MNKLKEDKTVIKTRNPIGGEEKPNSLIDDEVRIVPSPKAE